MRLLLLILLILILFGGGLGGIDIQDSQTA
jgi:hypothetical protein